MFFKFCNLIESKLKNKSIPRDANQYLFFEWFKSVKKLNIFLTNFIQCILFYHIM